MRKIWRLLLFFIFLGSLILFIKGLYYFDTQMEELCVSNCKIYNFSYLISQGSIENGYNCFCSDNSSAPRPVPTEFTQLKAIDRSLGFSLYYLLKRD